MCVQKYKSQSNHSVSNQFCTTNNINSPVFYFCRSHFLVLPVNRIIIVFEAQIQVCRSFIRLQLAMIQTSMPADLHFTLNVNTQSVRELKNRSNYFITPKFAGSNCTFFHCGMADIKSLYNDYAMILLAIKSVRRANH